MTDRSRRRVLAATCRLHHGPIGFANLVVTREAGMVVLDPHATGACVISLEDDIAARLRDVLSEWLG